jgi:excinuclease ABC subunit A
LRGTSGGCAYYRNRGGTANFEAAFGGVIGNLERYRETNSEYIRAKISEYMTDRPLPHLQARAQAEALAVTVDDA